jgi:tyrosinase
MDSFVSTPLELTASQAAGTFRRADIVFYEVDARGASFTARVFLDAPGPKPNTSPARKRGYAGFFTIFGHGGCFGDEGHCDVPAAGDRDPFDLDPPHPLTPQTKLVEVTERLKALRGARVIVTVLPVTPSKGGAKLIDALQFKSLRLLSYD